MKVLFVGNSSSAMWNFRQDVIGSLIKTGWDVAVISPDDGAAENFRSMGTKFVGLKNLDRKGISVIKDVQVFLELLSIYAREKPDIIIQYTVKPNIWGSFAAAFIRRVSIADPKIISVVTGLGYVFIKRSFLKLVVVYLYRFSFMFANKVIFLNRDDIEEFEAAGILKCNDEKSVLINGEGVDTTYFYPTALSPLQGTPKFLFVGRLLGDKGVREFIEAAVLLRQSGVNAIFQILGKLDPGNPAAISEAELESWVTSGAVRYLGSTNDVRPFFMEATAIVLPSYQEGMSRVLMEALAMGKPIIASNVRGCRELVENGKNGYLVKPRCAKSLAEGMHKLLLLSHSQRDQFGIRSREKSLGFDMGITIDRYTEIIDSLLNHSNANKNARQFHRVSR